SGRSRPAVPASPARHAGRQPAQSLGFPEIGGLHPPDDDRLSVFLQDGVSYLGCASYLPRTYFSAKVSREMLAGLDPNGGGPWPGGPGLGDGWSDVRDHRAGSEAVVQ